MSNALQIRIHEGFIDFNKNNVMHKDEFRKGFPYTFEISFNNTMVQDYMVKKCFMNEYEFIGSFGCLNCNNYVLHSIETDHYNQLGASKQTLVHFYAPDTHINFSCQFTIANCSGCAERSCERHSMLTGFHTILLPIDCIHQRGSPHVCSIPTALTLNSNFGIASVPSQNAVEPVSAHSKGISLSWLPWILIPALILLLLLLLLCFLFCCLRRRMSNNNKIFADRLENSNYKHFQAFGNGSTMQKDAKSGENGMAHYSEASQFHSSQTVLKKMPEDATRDVCKINQTDEIKRSLGTQTTAIIPETRQQVVESSNELVYSANNQRPFETPIFSTNSSQAMNRSDNYNDRYSKDTLHYYQERPIFITRDYGKVKAVSGIDTVVRTDDSNSSDGTDDDIIERDVRTTHTTRITSEIRLVDSQDNINTENERDQGVQHAIYAQTFF